MKLMNIIFGSFGVLSAIACLTFASALIPVLLPLDSYDPGDDEPTKTLTLTIDRKCHYIDVEASYSNIERYENDPVHNAMAITSSRYITTDDPLVNDVYDGIQPYLVGLTDTEKAQWLQTFVYLNTLYISDEDHQGVAEYIQYPAQTLFYGRGDCEDLAILLYTFYKMAGLDAILIQMPNHISVGVACDHWGETVTHAITGKSYVFADPALNYLGEPLSVDMAVAFNPMGMILPLMVFVTIFLGIMSLVILMQLWREYSDKEIQR